jgi:anthranilate phosphoribosyltransferase
VTGVFAKAWVEPLAHVLKNLGSEACWICHGEGGFDELVPSGRSWVSALKNGVVSSFEITPEDAGLPRSNVDDLKGGEAAHNAEALRAVLNGAPSAFADAAKMTVAAALMVAGRVDTMKQGVGAASDVLQSGAAARVLNHLVEVSNS